MEPRRAFREHIFECQLSISRADGVQIRSASTWTLSLWCPVRSMSRSPRPRVVATVSTVRCDDATFRSLLEFVLWLHAGNASYFSEICLVVGAYHDLRLRL